MKNKSKNEFFGWVVMIALLLPLFLRIPLVGFIALPFSAIALYLFTKSRIEKSSATKIIGQYLSLIILLYGIFALVLFLISS